MTDTTTPPLTDILGEMFYANVRIEKDKKEFCE